MGVVIAFARSLSVTAVLTFPLGAFASDASSYAVKGKHFDERDIPTYRIDTDGGTDWYTAEGYRAYHGNCRACHGPRGSGSPNGAPLTDTVAESPYFDFVDATVNGLVDQRGGAARIMPAYGTVPDVMCRLDAIYIYLRAEAAGALDDEKPIRASNASIDPIAELEICLGQ